MFSSISSFLFTIVAAAVVLVIMTYNRLHVLSEQVRRTKSDVLAVLQKRRSLAQKLADIAQTYGDQERLAHMSIGQTSTRSRTDKTTGEVISDVRALAMDFPELKANQTYQQLMSQLDEIETGILQRRENYNRAAEVYNSTRSGLPHVLYAHHIGFPRAPYFSLDDEDGVGIAEFATDDGARLREGVSNLGQRIASAASGAAVTQAATATEPPKGEPAAVEDMATPTALPKAEGNDHSNPTN